MSLAAQLERLFRPSDADTDLGRAAATVARLEYPFLNIDELLGALDDFAADIRESLPDDPRPESAVSSINRYLFEERGFRGNRLDYYNPRNSFLNDVMARRTGIPITLSVLYMEIARRLGLPIHGVGLPGHFLVKYDDRSRVFFIDPFHEGKVLNRQGCSDLVGTLHGRPVELNDAQLAAASKRQIIVRMLHNLRSIYVTSRQYRKALETLDAISAVSPSTPEDLRERAFLHQELGQRAQALQALEAYAARHPDAEDAEQLEQWRTNLKLTLARLN